MKRLTNGSAWTVIKHSDESVKQGKDYRHALVDTFSRENKAWHVSWHVQSSEVPDLTQRQHQSRYTYYLVTNKRNTKAMSTATISSEHSTAAFWKRCNVLVYDWQQRFDDNDDASTMTTTTTCRWQRRWQQQQQQQQQQHAYFSGAMRSQLPEAWWHVTFKHTREITVMLYKPGEMCKL